jgi:predicted RNase H-like HicB family nuclease
MWRVELDREDDGRWIAEVVELPGVLAYGATREEAIKRVKALSLRVLADRIEHGTEA